MLKQRLDLGAIGLLVLGGSIAVACGSGDESSSHSSKSPAQLSTVSELTPGSDCEHGGLLVENGVDDDGSGELDDAEVDGSFTVCNGSPGANGMDGSVGANGRDTLTSVAAASSEACPAGGSVLSTGIDEDDDGELANDEVLETVTTCSGVMGDNGTDGKDACGGAVRVTSVAPGEACEAGGILVEFGADLSTVTSGMGGAGGMGGTGAGEMGCDGTLSDEEVTGSQYACHGVKGDQGLQGDKGDPGNDGMSSAIKIYPDDGTNCLTGGWVVETGLDANENGILDASELDHTEYLCNAVGTIPTSDLFTTDQANRILEWIGADDTEWQLLYKGSVDGLNPTAFHTKVDSASKTFFVATLSTGVKVGGYAAKSWSGSGYYANSSDNFLFSLTNDFKHENSGNYGWYSQFNHPSYGPTFGGGHDFYAPLSSSGYCNLGHSYACRVDGYGTTACREDFCGTYSGWTVTEIEVYGPTL